MGQGTATALSEIKETRRRLERDITELTQRLPAPAIWAKRLAGLAVGGGVGGSLFWFVVHRLRHRAAERREKEALEAKKRKAARVTESPVVTVLPPEWGEKLGELVESGRWKGPALAIGAVWLLLRWMELRRMKQLTKAMLGPG